MTYKNRLRALLSKGYFPKELPPVFTTESFGAHSDDILKDWESDGLFKVEAANKVPVTKSYKNGSYTYVLTSTEIEVISKPKRGYERRNINITHPLPQALLSYEIAKNWKSVLKWLSRQTFSLDEILISESYDRAIKGINFAIHRAKKSYIEATSDWLVCTDISRFYPTIYTHSIPWAAYGKETVKGNLKLYQGSLADRLDALVRACNRNQTVGIPIGPETSRIIAEVISSRIDSDFKNKERNIITANVDRLQDDWFLGAGTLEEAERLLSTIAEVYRHYGLEINGSKTSVDRAIGTSGSQWVSEIGAFLSHRPGLIRGSRFSELLSLGLRLQSKHPAEPVINYILAILENQNITSSDVDELESFLLKAAVVSPISMDRICRIILNVQHRTNRLSRQRISKRFTVLAERNLEKGNLFEVIWLIYTLRGLKTPLISKKMLSQVENVASSALALILLDMESKELCTHLLPKQTWAKRINSESVRSDWVWLLGYEAIRQNWLPDPDGLMTQPFFKAMRKRDVVFYDPARNIKSSKTIMARERHERKKANVEVQRLMHVLRGFNINLY